MKSIDKTRIILEVKIEKNRVLDVLEGNSNFEDWEHYHRAIDIFFYFLYDVLFEFLEDKVLRIEYRYDDLEKVIKT
jgi:hypothetical protein